MTIKSTNGGPAYYNEIDPYAAQTLRNLIKAGYIAPGDVDERSIEDVLPSDLKPYTQCHFFAGIGVWSYALRRSGWADDRQVWTGSCPCQPFSAAGKGAGFTDERHLWPAWHHLIEQCRPATVLGEQVASKDGLTWLDLVYADMEAADYAFAAVDLCAAGVGAPHIRQRLWFVADADHTRLEGWRKPGRERGTEWLAGPGGVVSRVADADSDGCSTWSEGSPTLGYRQAAGADCGSGGLADTSRLGRHESGHGHHGRDDGAELDADGQDAEREQPVDWLADADHGEQSQLPNGKREGQEQGCSNGSTSMRVGDTLRVGREGALDIPVTQQPEEPEQGHEPLCVGQPRPGPTNGLWRTADWLHCRDGKWRAVEPGTFPLAHGAPSRVGRLRAYGNAINAEAACAFIGAYLEDGAGDL